MRIDEEILDPCSSRTKKYRNKPWVWLEFVTSRIRHQCIQALQRVEGRKSDGKVSCRDMYDAMRWSCKV